MSEDISQKHCVSCGAPATHACDMASSLVCGAPLCDECTHADWNAPKGAPTHYRKGCAP